MKTVDSLWMVYALRSYLKLQCSLPKVFWTLGTKRRHQDRSSTRCIKSMTCLAWRSRAITMCPQRRHRSNQARTTRLSWPKSMVRLEASHLSVNKWLIWSRLRVMRRKSINYLQDTECWDETYLRHMIDGQIDFERVTDNRVWSKIGITSFLWNISKI